MSLINTCSSLWDFDDVTRCARVIGIEYQLPSIALIASLAIVIAKLLINLSKYKDDDPFSPEAQPLLSGDNNGQYTEASTFTEATKKKHFDIASLQNIKLNGEAHGILKKLQRSKSEKFKVVLEFLLVLAELVLNFIKFNSDSEFTKYDIIANLSLWSWLLVTVIFRLANLNDNYPKLLKIVPNVWVNNFIIYLTLWFPKILVFRSTLIGHIGEESAFYYQWDFAIVTILLFNLLFSKIGYKLPSIYITNPDTTPAPEPFASLFSFITFSWINPFIWKAFKEVIKFDQVWDLRVDDYSYYVLKSFKKFSANHTKWSFSKRTIAFFSNYILLQCFWAGVESVIVFVPTILLKKILEFVEDREASTINLAWFYVFSMFGAKILAVIASGQGLFNGRRVCIRLKSIIIGEVYAKALRRRISTEDKVDKEEKKDKETAEEEAETALAQADKEDLQSTSNLGAIINLMAVDAFKVSEVCAYLQAFVGAAIMLVVSIYLLYILLGWSALVGALSIIALSPLTFHLSRLMGFYQKKMLAVTDKRIQKLNETFQAIRIIKFFAWEEKFRKEILDIRHEELGYLKKRSIVWTVASVVWFITPTIVTFISFGCFIFIAKQRLTTPIAFTALSLFNMLRNPLDQLSDMLSFVIQSKVSLDRVQNFLEEEETTKYEQLTYVKDTGKLGFKDASFSWNSKSDIDFKLRNLNIDFKKRKLNVVVGPTGSGKTSLLMALLGEMELIGGEVYLPGYNAREDLVVDSEGYTESVAYCSQAAWLLNDTIRNNIIFSAPFNKERYNEVVKACGLARDFEILKAGDQTEIGEKGIALSGGQKQRVSLARALYSNSRHILLDDCLSAVDSHTALHIYENCITGPLMQNRTVILVSHNVALTLKEADHVVVMENGRITHQGTPEDVFHAGALGDDEMIKSTVGSRQSSSVNLKQKLSDAKKKQKEGKKGPVKVDLVDEEAEELENLKKGKLIEEETKTDGVVSVEVYKWFLQLFGGWPVIFFIISMFVSTQLLYIYQSWWVRAWAKAVDQLVAISIMGSAIEGQQYGFITKSLFPFVLKYHYAKEQMTIMKSENPSVYYIIIYSLLGAAYAFGSSLRILYIFFSGIRASSRIFKRILDKVLRAKLRFFDSTPIGRIMNRFSKDIESVDQELVAFGDGVISCLISVIFTLALITFIVPGFLFLAILIALLYYAVAFFYLNSSRELKRFDSITKSPIHQHFSETLVGVSTIRAYGIERRFLQENLCKIDDNNKPFFYMWLANRWLSTRNDIVGALVVLASGSFVLWKIDALDAGLAGIALSYGIAFNESALWVIRLYANVEMTMNSVERLKEYLDIEEEPEEYIKSTEPPSSWPQNGKLEVHDLSLRYAPHLPQVIKNVSFEVEPSSKIGIVGRTGAGKSTIITALFRFLDPETGFIKIDDVNITSIGLKTLRQAITIIPQDPTLFTGTIKSNLDPFNAYSVEQIFEALKRVNLISSDEVITNAENGTSSSSIDDENVNKFLNLENMITEGGGNLSQGQRQLMCLARSLLKAPKIMLLDEATASIDYESDARIQETIRKEFASSTILTIAHRLRSIIDYDKILVMDAGEVIEFDHPYSLISNEKSIFRNMCVDSGELDVLIQLAKESFIQKVNKK